ncbi:MAG: putative transcriptional regulator, CopG/Arc/MetJ family [Caulobacter sp.]|nr:putative transcriptional regulator, CopG/Arc/MetJ family [Caulobacter sp.]
MNVSLTPELEQRIADKVSTGLYTTASEVVREALRLLFEADETRDRLKARLNAEIQVGLDQLDRGEGLDGAAVFDEVGALIKARRAAR